MIIVAEAPKAHVSFHATAKGRLVNEVGWAAKGMLAPVRFSTGTAMTIDTGV
jgi:hypothetical protein